MHRMAVADRGQSVKRSRLPFVSGGRISGSVCTECKSSMYVVCVCVCVCVRVRAGSRPLAAVRGDPHDQITRAARSR